MCRIIHTNPKTQEMLNSMLSTLFIRHVRVPCVTKFAQTVYSRLKLCLAYSGYVRLIAENGTSEHGLGLSKFPVVLARARFPRRTIEPSPRDDLDKSRVLAETESSVISPPSSGDTAFLYRGVAFQEIVLNPNMNRVGFFTVYECQ